MNNNFDIWNLDPYYMGYDFQLECIKEYVLKLKFYTRNIEWNVILDEIRDIKIIPWNNISFRFVIAGIEKSIWISNVWYKEFILLNDEWNNKVNWKIIFPSHLLIPSGIQYNEFEKCFNIKGNNDNYLKHFKEIIQCQTIEWFEDLYKKLFKDNI